MAEIASTRLYNIKETAERLGVNAEKLILWNENNILKPTIMITGEVGYREEQIEQFLAIQGLLKSNQETKPVKAEELVMAQTSRKTNYKYITVTTMLVFIFSFSATVILSTMILKTLTKQKDTQASVTASQTGLLDPYVATINSVPQNGTDLKPVNTYGEMVSNPVFDYRGNIKGKTPDTDVLAATSFANGSVQESSTAKQTMDLNLLLLIFAAGLIATPFLFKKRPAYAAKNVPADSLAVSEGHKVAELNQKTDGTVVLCYQGQEYKVSKPEMDSESDQFIERLMGLVSSGVKEIDYDAMTDQEVKLSTPLSKIVTRLGFVGIKRDLFFPRTSKNKVLFRRYLTQEDLTAMNLNAEQIISEFSL